jgi:hypothetical protein
MLKKILIGVGVVVVGFAGFVATRPAEFKVEREATIAAPPDVVFAQVNDYHEWVDWSPWAGLDPNMKTEYSGADRGVGAMQSWAGNDDVGEGRQTIVASDPQKHIGIRLEFLKPFEATNSVDFEFEPAGAGTKVRWIMSGEHDFMGKAACLFMDMDSMVGKDFEKGLASLGEASIAAAKEKEKAEAAAREKAEAEAKATAEAAEREAAEGEAAEGDASKAEGGVVPVKASAD